MFLVKQNDTMHTTTMKTKINDVLIDDVFANLKEVFYKNTEGDVNKLPKVSNLLCNLDGATWTYQNEDFVHQFVAPNNRPTVNKNVSTKIGDASIEADYGVTEDNASLRLGKTLAEPLKVTLTETCNGPFTIHLAFKLLSMENDGAILTTTNGVHMRIYRNAANNDIVIGMRSNGGRTNDTSYNMVLQLDRWYDVILVYNGTKFDWFLDGLHKGAYTNDATNEFDALAFNCADINGGTPVGDVILRTCRVWNTVLDIDDIYYTRTFMNIDRKVIPKIGNLWVNIDAAVFRSKPGQSYLVKDERQGTWLKGGAILTDAGVVGAGNLLNFNSTATSLNDWSLGITNDMQALYIGKEHKSSSLYISYEFPNNNIVKTWTIALNYRVRNVSGYRGDFGFFNSKLRIESVSASDRRLYADTLTNAIYDRNHAISISDTYSGYAQLIMVCDNESQPGKVKVKVYRNGEHILTGTFNGNFAVEKRIYFAVKINGNSYYVGHNMFIKSFRVWDTLLTDNDIASLWKYELPRM